VEQEFGISYSFVRCLRFGRLRLGINSHGKSTDRQSSHRQSGNVAISSGNSRPG
jgi:hypothetical protein